MPGADVKLVRKVESRTSTGLFGYSSGGFGKGRQWVGVHPSGKPCQCSISCSEPCSLRRTSRTSGHRRS